MKHTAQFFAVALTSSIVVASAVAYARADPARTRASSSLPEAGASLRSGYPDQRIPALTWVPESPERRTLGRKPLCGSGRGP